jgi:hypothetical protein
VARYETAGQIIRDAAQEVGIIISDATDPFASTDPAIIQLCRLLTSCGRELLGNDRVMTKFIRTLVHVTPANPVAADSTIDLPEDLGYLLDQTGWNPTTRLPLGGPMSPVNWDYLLYTNLAASVIYVTFRIAQGKMNILPSPPPANTTLTFSYVSRYWVGDFANDRVSSSDDVVNFEPIVIMKFLKLRFLEAKGFDTSAAAQQYMNAFESWVPKTSTSPVINISRRKGYPFLGNRNIPETGYGR